MHWKDNKLTSGISLAACTCKFDMIPNDQHNHNNYQEDSNYHNYKICMWYNKFLSKHVLEECLKLL